MGNEWFDKLQKIAAIYVPDEEPAETEAGELVRAVSWIVNCFLEKGEMIAIESGNESCNSPARYIKEQYPDSEMTVAVDAIWGMNSNRLYEIGLGMLAEQTVRFIETHPEMKTQEARYDCMDFYESEDRNWDAEDDEYWCSDRPTQRELDLAEYPPLDWRR